jgi:hypothetical protein
MIIELPVLPDQRGTAKRYKMGFFHFSNNNLAIRKACAQELGGYDPHLPASEDVDLCFRLALSATWVACREPGVIIRHKARKTLRATLRQMWNWGINLARPYRRTGITGIYLYWVSPQRKTITRDLEIATFPILVSIFVTPFHLLHALTVLSVLLAVYGAMIPALLCATLTLASGHLYLQDILHLGLRRWPTLKLAVVHYLTNVTFITAAFLGGLSTGMILLPASIFPPTGKAER